MPDRISIRPEDHQVVAEILRMHLPPEAQVWVFGSRARGTDKRAADLDLAIDAGRRLTPDEMLTLELAFEESVLPYRVDVVDRQNIEGIFRENLLQDAVIFTQPD